MTSYSVIVNGEDTLLTPSGQGLGFYLDHTNGTTLREVGTDLFLNYDQDLETFTFRSTGKVYVTDTLHDHVPQIRTYASKGSGSRSLDSFTVELLNESSEKVPIYLYSQPVCMSSACKVHGEIKAMPILLFVALLIGFVLVMVGRK